MSSGMVMGEKKIVVFHRFMKKKFKINIGVRFFQGCKWGFWLSRFTNLIPAL